MILLKNDCFIESDGTQYILKREITREKKDSKEQYKADVTIGYYGELSQALEGYTRTTMLEKNEK